MVLGINFITVAACREGIVEYLGFQNGDRDACVFSHIWLPAITCCCLRDLGINFITVALSRGGHC